MIEKILDKKQGKAQILCVSKISIVGSGISNHIDILKTSVNTFEEIKEKLEKAGRKSSGGAERSSRYK